MKFTILLKSEDTLATPLTLVEIDRTDTPTAGSLRLTMAESKQLLARVQVEIGESQIRLLTKKQRICRMCGSRRVLKDYHPTCFKSLFGRVPLRVPRFYCVWEDQHAHSQTVRIDGLTNWISPEQEFIQSQLAATVPYARTAELLELLLPVAVVNTPSTVRRHTLGVGQRLDARLQEPVTTVSVMQPQADPVTVVGLDSGYVRDCRFRSATIFEIFVGRLLCKNKVSRSLGFVRTLECDRVAGERLKQRLQEYGTTIEIVTAMTDGDTGLRGLILFALSQARPILDWFNLTQRLTVLKRVLYGEEAIDQLETPYHDRLCHHLESLKWRLWHGYCRCALNRILALLFTLRLPSITGKRAAVRLRRLIKELRGYLNNNLDSLVNYGLRYRSGERITTTFMENAVNQLIDKRMSKSQQMRWSPQGADWLLQLRTELVDGRLGNTFARWYPGFTGERLSYQATQ